MKTSILTTIFYTVLLLSCNQSDNKSSIAIKEIVRPQTTNSSKQDSSKFPVFAFVDVLHDFGKVKRGAIVEYGFRFKNVGKVPLLIKNIEASCGCTVVDFPKDSILPGDSSKIQVYINTKENKHYKNGLLGILANTMPERTELFVKMSLID